MPLKTKSKEYYLAIWEGLCGTFLGWPRERMLEWVRETGKERELEEPDSLVFHQPPHYWFARLLVTERGGGELPAAERNRIQGQVLSAFKDPHNYRFPVDTDWSQFLPRVESVLQQTGMNGATSEARVVDTDCPAVAGASMMRTGGPH
jgi:hypothetical protein